MIATVTVVTVLDIIVAGDWVGGQACVTLSG